MEGEETEWETEEAGLDWAARGSVTNTGMGLRSLSQHRPSTETVDETAMLKLGRTRNTPPR